MHTSHLTKPADFHTTSVAKSHSFDTSSLTNCLQKSASSQTESICGEEHPHRKNEIGTDLLALKTSKKKKNANKILSKQTKKYSLHLSVILQIDWAAAHLQAWTPSVDCCRSELAVKSPDSVH